MTDWGRIKTSAKLIEDYARNLDNPFDIFELLKKIESIKLGWQGLNKALDGNELVETEIGYISKCAKRLEEEFLFSMDMWIYSIMDEDKKDISEKLSSTIKNNNELGYKLIFTFAEYKQLLPIMWETYKTLLEEKGITPNEENYQMLWNDIFSLETNVRDTVYNPEVAYA
jgi:hypothetical protein